MAVNALQQRSSKRSRGFDRTRLEIALQKAIARTEASRKRQKSDHHNNAHKKSKKLADAAPTANRKTNKLKLDRKGLRTLPNIAISGTPGVGKSHISKALVTALQGVSSNFYRLDFAAQAAEAGHRERYDEGRKSWVIDEDRAAKAFTPSLKSDGGAVIDWIHADQFSGAPRGPLDLVVTLRASTEVLYDRLLARGYDKGKVDENMDAEIMGEVAEENREAFEGVSDEDDSDSDQELRRMLPTIEVWERGNSTDEEGKQTVERIVDWVRSWRQKRSTEEEVSINGTMG